MLASTCTWASTRSMERNGHDCWAISWPVAARILLRGVCCSLVLRQQTHNEQFTLSCTVLLQSPVVARIARSVAAASRLIGCACQHANENAEPGPASLAEQTATFTHAQPGLQAGKVRGCCNQTASQPTVEGG